ncbi:Ribonuclease H-like domain [Cinara cedri]|uniref:Ribonuclease H-like domain n=1 Tax=Cinara cedri TaxID=506608 RepID=A0A5E4NB53_9HEMI|nr:Ribonuclease H-like domain [Cinara cedri]
MARTPQGLHSFPNATFDNLYKKYQLENILTTEISISPPWLISININLDLHQNPKKSTCPTHYNNLLKEILLTTPQHALIFTDASVTKNHTGMAIIHGDSQTQWKLSNKCFIYTAKALSILKAIEFVTNKSEASQIIIFKPPSPVNTSYMWVLGNYNRAGNERADKAAKLAHLSDNSLTSLDFSFQDVKRIIAKDTYDLLEKKWLHVGWTNVAKTRSENFEELNDSKKAEKLR